MYEIIQYVKVVLWSHESINYYLSHDTAIQMYGGYQVCNDNLDISLPAHNRNLLCLWYASYGNIVPITVII